MKFLNKLRRDKRGITGMVIGLIVLLIACAVLIPIGVIITASLKKALPALDVVTQKLANETAEAVFTNVYNAFSIAAIVPFVAAAALIIGIIVTAFAVRGRAGP